MLSDLIASDNYIGVKIAPQGAAAASGTLEGIEATGNSGVGVYVTGMGTSAEAIVTVADSILAHNGSGLSITFRATVFADGVHADYNDAGFPVGPDSTLRLTRSSAIKNNLSGVYNFGTTVSYGDNRIDGNKKDIEGSPLTPAAEK
jgi:hypothetical protein